MLNNKLVGVVVPAYNEEKQILKVIDAMPAFVDRIIVVNDYSQDNTLQLLQDSLAKSPVASQLPERTIPVTSSGAIHYYRADEVFKELLIRQSKEHISREVFSH